MGIKKNKTRLKLGFSNNLSKKLLISFLVISVLFFSATLALIALNKNNNPELKNNYLNYKSEDIKPPEIAGELNTYKHSLRFNIIYPKITYQNQALCPLGNDVDLLPLSQMNKYIVLDDGEHIYITFPTTVVMSGEENNCEVKNVDLSMLSNGWPTIRYGKEMISFPESIKYTYKQINNENDIVSLAKSTMGENCSSLDKNLVDAKNQIYQIRPYNAEVRESFAKGSCTPNYNYDFYYSQKYNVAIVGNISQQPYDLIKKDRVTNAVRDGYHALVTFE